MEYVEPLIPDYISDNPFRNMKNNDNFFGGFDLPGESFAEDWDDEEGNEKEKESDQEEDVKSEDVEVEDVKEDVKEEAKQDENEHENEDSNFEGFNFDGPWNDSKSDDLPVANDLQKDTKVESLPVHAGLT